MRGCRGSPLRGSWCATASTPWCWRGAIDALAPDQRRARVLADFAQIFGADAATPIDYLDQRWGEEPFAPGGPTAAVPPGSWTRYGPLPRRPVGPLHWAGTETADAWTGFMDGAVRSGQRAAAEVGAALRFTGTRGSDPALNEGA